MSEMLTGGLARLPLQTGATALTRVVFGAAPLVAGLGLYGEHHRHGDGAVTFSFFYVYFLPIIAFALKAALGSERASDVVMLPGEFTLEGGPHHGVRVQWSMVQGITESDGKVCLDLGDGVQLGLAHANNKAEQRSLKTLASVLAGQVRRLTRSDASASPATPAVPALVVCPSCGAPARIKASMKDAAETPCEACDAGVPVPPHVREKLAAAEARAASRATTARAVAALFKQPQARRVNSLLVMLGVLGFAWLPLAAVAGGFGTTTLVSAALFIAGALAVRVVVANRRALSAVCLGFAARHRGDQLECRSCGALLPRDEASEVVATCVYCDAENVVGAPETIEGGDAPDAARLGRALAARDRAVRAAVASSVLGLGLVVLGLAGALVLRGR